MKNSERFTEQAEYLSSESFNEWSTSVYNEAQIIKKLTQSGSKLITGPRGCGKTTLLLKAYNKLIKRSDASTLPVYVNFKSSLKLEPLYKSNVNAQYWFNQWLLFKVLKGINLTLKDLKLLTVSTVVTEANIDRVIENLEFGIVDNDEHIKITASQLIEEINLIFEKTGRSKCVLLLDDAGHAFSSEQQQDFFEFFKEIKTRSISPKAAVYPGVTSYSSTFHIGHDAEEIDVWQKPSLEGYMDFMHSFLKARLGEPSYNELNKNKNLLDLLCYSAYGIPRALLNMVADFLDDDEGNEEDSQDNSKQKFISKYVLQAIKNNFDKTYKIYDSLRIKLPMYVNFVSEGSRIYEKFVMTVKGFNLNGTIRKQSSIIAIQRPITPGFYKVLGFFQYAGLVSAQGISNRGGKGTYELYELHYSTIIDRNIFFSNKSINVENYCEAFQNRPNHFYPRHSTSNFLPKEGEDAIFKLALPPCNVCNTPRLSEDSKFCSNCGSSLKNMSVFESIVLQGLENLPITTTRATSIKDNSSLVTIKDILIDNDNKQLRQVPRIGPVWAKRIKTYAEEFIA